MIAIKLNHRPIRAFFIGISIFFSQASYGGNEFGVGFGPFLPSRISGVREVINGLGGRIGFDTSKGFFEFEYYTGHGGGSDYHTINLDYRLDLKDNDLIAETPVFLILGFNGDMYRPSTITDFRQSGGWHYGGGVRIPLGGAGSPVHLRADFKHRFGPGNSLIVLLGFGFSTGAKPSEAP